MTNYMSHVKTVQSLDQVIATCTGLGGNYNPGHQNLQLNALSQTLASARIALDEVKSAKNMFNNVTNDREISFGDISPLATRILRALKYSKASEQMLDDANTVIRKLRGRKLKNPAPVTPPAT